MNIRRHRLTLLYLGVISCLSGTAQAQEGDVVGTLMRTINTWQFSPPSPDPSGLAFVCSPFPCVPNSLLDTDAEVDELAPPNPGAYQGANLFTMDPSGNQVATATSATTASFPNPNAYSNEPAGAAFNPLNGHLFISDDILKKVFEIDPGPDGLLHTADDIRTSFSTSAFGSFDPEGLAYDPIEGALYISDGVGSEVYKVTPGADGVFNGVPPTGNDIVTHFDTERLGILDPEGIEFEAGGTEGGHLYLVGEPITQVAHVYAAGPLIRKISIAAANPKKPAGLALDPATSHLYVADRRVDNDANPNENDGQVYEFSVPPLPAGNLAPGVEAGQEQPIVFPASAVLDGTVVDDGLPSGQVTTSWTQVSGPGIVNFANPSTVDTTATFSMPGIYVLRLTADDGARYSSDDVTVTASPANPAIKTVHVSLKASGTTASGLVYKDEDILTYDVGTGTWSMYFDGSDVGLGAGDIDAFAILDDGSILMSFLDDGLVIPNGVGAIDDSDIVRFIPTSLGSTTAGTFEMYFDGSDVGLIDSAEDVDGIAFIPDGRLVVSTSGSFSVTSTTGTTLSGKDEDLIAFTATDFGAETNGAWQMYFDGSDVGLSTASSEDVNEAWIAPTGDIYLTTLGTFSVSGANGDGDDVFRCVPGTTGSATTCTYNFTWDGIGGGLPVGAVVDGVELKLNL